MCHTTLSLTHAHLTKAADDASYVLLPTALALLVAIVSPTPSALASAKQSSDAAHHRTLIVERPAAASIAPSLLFLLNILLGSVDKPTTPRRGQCPTGFLVPPGWMNALAADDIFVPLTGTSALQPINSPPQRRTTNLVGGEVVEESGKTQPSLPALGNGFPGWVQWKQGSTCGACLHVSLALSARTQSCLAIYAGINWARLSLVCFFSFSPGGRNTERRTAGDPLSLLLPCCCRPDSLAKEISKRAEFSHRAQHSLLQLGQIAKNLYEVYPW
jgi:hypothetical protein